jgi:hypothetical protein
MADTRIKLIGFILSICFIVSMVSAIPIMSPASNIGNNNFTLTCGAAVGDTFFKWGTQEDYQLVWTVNVTPNGEDVATTTEYGSPISPMTTYYATCCDSTGCDDTPVSFNTTSAVPIPTSTLGKGIDNMTASRFNVLYMPYHIVTPYTWWLPEDERQTATMIVFGTVFLFVYLGLWLRGRGVAVAVIMGLLTSSMVVSANSGLHLGIPEEFMVIAHALLVTSIAGIFLIFLKK